MPYNTIDLCAGIGGIRKGFELNGNFINVLSAEIDNFACQTYEHLFGDNPANDLTSETFKLKVEETNYDILLAGFPCQTFSRAGLKEGFDNETKGIIFAHIVDIARRTRPKALFLENVDHLITHNKGETIKQIIETLEIDLNYKITGVTNDNENLVYNPKDFIRNSKHFGVPQNRPRTYIMGFDRELYGDLLNSIPNTLPSHNELHLYNDLYDVFEENVAPNFYMASGYFNTLIAHRERQRNKGNGFGYKIVNTPEIEIPIANTLLATGGSGKERNLVIDVQPGIAGAIVRGKATPINNQCIRVMTPTEWGTLQGFIGYAFLDDNGVDTFTFPNNISNAQKYKQFGNSVTIPVIETMAGFMLEILERIDNNNEM